MAKKILVIDDAAAVRQVVDLSLRTKQFEVIEAADGEEGLRRLRESEVDLIICDVKMPNIDGIQFLETLKHDPAYAEFRFIPIIMLTTEAGMAMKQKGKDLGARAWLVKPFLPEQLIAAVEKLVC